MNLTRQLLYYRMMAALTPRAGAAHARWRDKKHRLRTLLHRRERAEFWDRRIADILACPDTPLLPRHLRAGTVEGRDQFMHNGLRVALGSYYTPHLQRLLAASGGVHEPQEERVFAALLPQFAPGSVMLELGAYWAFYSLWFHQAVSGARNFMVEPDPANLNTGQLNFALNHFAGEFLQAGLGARFRTQAYDAPIVSVDWLARHFALAHVHLLHSDIQGFELAMLQGAEQLLRARRVDYVFLSTHSERLHAACRDHLRQRDFHFIAEHTPAQSYSVDGLLVARRSELAGPEQISISKKP